MWLVAVLTALVQAVKYCQSLASLLHACQSLSCLVALGCFYSHGAEDTEQGAALSR